MNEGPDTEPIWSVCPHCKHADALIENQTPHSVIYWCRFCGHRWSDEEPRCPKH
jgi:hypothetical protein